MTELSFQECRKVMKRANWLRGQITKAEGDVAKWTKIEQSYIEQLKQGSADGAKKYLDKVLKKLEEVRKVFTDLEFPANDLISPALKRCNKCGAKSEKDHVCEEDKQ